MKRKDPVSGSRSHPEKKSKSLDEIRSRIERKKSKSLDDEGGGGVSEGGIRPLDSGFSRCPDHACLWHETDPWDQRVCFHPSDQEVLELQWKLQGLDLDESRRQYREALGRTKLAPGTKCRMIRNMCMDRPSNLAHFLTLDPTLHQGTDVRPRNCRILRDRMLRELKQEGEIPEDLDSNSFVLQVKHVKRILALIDRYHFHGSLDASFRPYEIRMKPLVEADGLVPLAQTERLAPPSRTIRITLDGIKIRDAGLRREGLWARSPLEGLILTIEHELVHMIQFRWTGQSGHDSAFLNLARYWFGHSGLDFMVFDGVKRQVWALEEDEEHQEEKNKEKKNSQQEGRMNAKENKRSQQQGRVKQEQEDTELDLGLSKLYACEDRIVRIMASRIRLRWHGHLRLPTPENLNVLVRLIHVEYGLETQILDRITWVVVQDKQETPLWMEHTLSWNERWNHTRVTIDTKRIEERMRHFMRSDLAALVRLVEHALIRIALMAWYEMSKHTEKIERVSFKTFGQDAQLVQSLSQQTKTRLDRESERNE